MNEIREGIYECPICKGTKCISKRDCCKICSSTYILTRCLCKLCDGEGEIDWIKYIIGLPLEDNIWFPLGYGLMTYNASDPIRCPNRDKLTSSLVL